MQKKIAVFILLTVLMGLTCLGCDYYPLKSDPPDSPYFQIKVDTLTVMSPFKHVSTTREADHLLPSSVEQKRQNTAFKSLFQPSHSGTPHLDRAAGQTQFARLSISVAIPR